MEAFELLRYPSTPLFALNSHLQFPDDGLESMPLPSLLENHGLYPQFPPSSPSLEMQVAMDHLPGSAYMDLSSFDASLEYTDVLMADPYVDFLNEILMAEEQEDSLRARNDSQASYDAMVKSFYDVIREPLPLDWASSQHFAPALESSSSSDTSCKDDLHNEAITSSRDVSSLPVKERSAGCNQQEGKPQGLTITSSSLDVLFEELNVEADYANLYVGTHSLSVASSNADKASYRTGMKKKSAKNGWKDARHVQNGSSAAASSVELRELLVSCAQAVAVGDVKKAYQILHELQHVHGVSLQGNSLQRIAQLFCDALVARMTGMGSQLYQKCNENMPSVASILKATRIWYEMQPLLKITHYFANQNILKAAEGASRLHIVDFGITHGMQWPCLINALADREGGPPLLVVTGIDDSKVGKNCLERLKECGQRLAAYANRYNVPFQFRPLLSEEWENIDPVSLQLQESEVLVVNAVKRLSLLADESVDSSKTTSPREKLLLFLRSLNPHLFLMAETNLACSSPFFVGRFREALNFFYSKQDMHDTVCSDDPDRLVVEQSFCTQHILNIVACEGSERVVRPETFKQWDLRLKRAGFDLLPMPPRIQSRAKLYVKQHYHRDFMVLDDGKGWMLLGWKGRTLHAMSAWKPSNM